MIKQSLQNGFMALISTIIISVILLSMAVSLNFTNFYTQSNTLDSELKETSFNLAESCVNIGLLKLIQNPNYHPDNELVNINSNTCTIISINVDTIETMANYKNYITHLRAKTNSIDGSIQALEEF